MMATGFDDGIYLLDLHVLGGYDTVENRKDPLPAVREQFGVPHSVGLLPEMAKWIDDTISLITFEQLPCGFDDFVRFRDAWANPGASTLGQTARFEVLMGARGTKKVTARSKWMKALSLSDAEVIEQSRAGGPALVRPFRKADEPAKARTVQCYDTLSLIRVSYMALAIKDLNGVKTWTTAEMGQKAKLAARRDLLRPDGFTRVCVDQSEFDINQAKEAVVYAIKALFSRIIKFGGRDARKIAEAELNSLEGAFLELPRERVPWKKGVLSGYKWTSLIDSILNRAATMTVASRLGWRVRAGLFHGDDAIIKVDGDGAGDLAGEFQRLGLSVNPLKTWVSRDRCEYLHEMYCSRSKRVLGFPARVAKSVMWKKPAMGGSDSRGVAAVNEDIDLYRKLERRGLLCGLALAKRRLGRLDPSSDRKKLLEALDTPLALGGLGFGSAGRMVCRLVQKQVFHHSIRQVSRVKYDALGDLTEFAILNRLGGSVAIPGFGVGVEFSRFRGLSRLPEHSIRKATAMPHVHRAWSVYHYKRVADPYVRKVKLEWSLRSRETIGEDLVPDEFFARSPLGPDASYRLFNRWISQNVDLSSSQTEGGVYAAEKSFIDRAWAGFVSMAAMAYDVSLQPAWVQVCELAWAMCVASPSGGLRLRV